MIIKLPIHFSYARHKEARVHKPLTLKEKIKADRIVMTIMMLIMITLAIAFV
ncbi:hypothetical protein [Pedobacter frigiditerrae]|uniref:hypothetical protein n=1 Tax=Pedobacter frigiditerrae TaxID=2530452 RepID=UPI00292EA035|nr:hypothetical protein [Pedobacter frigiditerrae]